MQGNISRGFIATNIHCILSHRCFPPIQVNAQGSSRKCFLHNQKIYENLNIPDKPKKPLNPFLKFVEQVRPALNREFPHLKNTELIKLAAQKWNNVDSRLKEKITQDYKEAYNKYKVLSTKYEQSLTPEQRKLIEEAKLHISELKEEREMKKKSKELGKPKKPAGIFIKYLLSKSNERDKYTDNKDFMKAIAQEWKSVSADVKVKLENERKQEIEKFNGELKLWEERMINEGNIDIVRKGSLDKVPQPTTKLKK